MNEHVVEYHYVNTSKQVMELSNQADALVQSAEGASTKLRLAMLEQHAVLGNHMNELQENRAMAINRLRKIRN